MSGRGSRSSPSSTTDVERSPERIDAESRVVAELDAWRAGVIPDSSTPLDAEELARLVWSCFQTLGIEPDVGADFSVHTVHYYRRKDILDAPAGRTSAARYDVRHVWQAAGARLAGYLGLVTLAEARRVMRGADERALVGFVAARVTDARARTLMRRSANAPWSRAVAEPNVYALGAVSERAPLARARPLPGVYAAAASPIARAEMTAPGVALPAIRSFALDAPSAPATTPARRDAIAALVIPLTGDASCILPASHPAHHSIASARQLVRELAIALGVPLDARIATEREESQT